MTVPAREVKVGWRVNPGTPHEWVAKKITELITRPGTIEIASAENRRNLWLQPDDPVDAAPPRRTITVPAMDDEALALARKIADPTNPGCREAWPFVMWLADAIAANDGEAT